ncbi:MAG: helix-turn-helix transcriptional regulator [Clostridia bacterium]|nr:helix-turn-helix transcriptional regulator [Clostridia bacterium]
MIVLGERIKELRRRDGRTQEALASELGVTAQAVSRWEKGICYPDMELIPPIANFFGVSIDELFGYDNERTKKIDALYDRITSMNAINNGKDLCVDECIALAREALIEFPGNDKLTAALASALYNAGSVRRGEFHVDGPDGFEMCDVERHRAYPEWQEAVKLYEKVLPALNSGDLRNRAVQELAQLYQFIGEGEKAALLADSAPALNESKPFLRINAFDGKEAVAARGDALIDLVLAAADLIAAIVRGDRSLPPATAAELLDDAVAMFGIVCKNGDYGKLRGTMSSLYLLKSYYLWLADDRDGAFEALDRAFELSSAFDDEPVAEAYTSPLLRYTKPLVCTFGRKLTPELPEIWPFWDVPEAGRVRNEMQADPRWEIWERKTRR